MWHLLLPEERSLGEFSKEMSGMSEKNFDDIIDARQNSAGRFWLALSFAQINIRPHPPATTAA
jgi:hypothetical protein